MAVGLVAGAQVTCILVLPSMIAWACFHYSAGGTPHAVVNFALIVALAYVGFVPFPAVPPVEWTPAAIWMTIMTVLTILPALPPLMGGKMTDAVYAKRPYLKKQFCDDCDSLLGDVGSGDEKAKHYRRARELAWGANLLGAASCMAAAIVSGGAQDLCLVMVLPMVTNGYCHWLRREEHEDEKAGAIFCPLVAAVTLGLGLAR